MSLASNHLSLLSRSAAPHTSSQPSPTAANFTVSGSFPSAGSTSSHPPLDSQASSSSPSSSSSAASSSNFLLPTIRLLPYYDPRATKPSLPFTPITRTLTSPSSILRVGRYTERGANSFRPLLIGSNPATNTFANSISNGTSLVNSSTISTGVVPNSVSSGTGDCLSESNAGISSTGQVVSGTSRNSVVSDSPIGFKSKVVSRRHCEFWCVGSQWYIKDVCSSSGTFLNHIRLSPPGVESKPHPISDGDVVQLGIDFRGGEELIFRCVKIRIEVGRDWQTRLNDYNQSVLRSLQRLAVSTKRDDTCGPNDVCESNRNSNCFTSECSICLMTIAPFQSLFVAPCSHVWHFKCIQPLLYGPMSPSFLCPNCRAIADLDADIEEPDLQWSGGSQDPDVSSNSCSRIVKSNHPSHPTHSVSRDLSFPFTSSDDPSPSFPMSAAHV